VWRPGRRRLRVTAADLNRRIVGEKVVQWAAEQVGHRRDGSNGRLDDATFVAGDGMNASVDGDGNMLAAEASVDASLSQVEAGEVSGHRVSMMG
jgi:hypothetical protein